MDRFSDNAQPSAHDAPMSAYDNLEEYVRQREPDARAKGSLWQTAIGLQAVDGLAPSDYLLETAKRNIDGEISLGDAKDLVHAYYASRAVRESADPGTEEADKVSAHIAELLSEEAFVFSPGQLRAIHRRLFDGVYDFAGRIRDYNISKREWVLGGKSVVYAGADMIVETLEYDFARERAFEYAGLPIGEAIEHIAAFVANVWQVHPFGEGNTRTTAVFTIKYLRSLGFSVSNEPFAQHSWYFRNALVRANYSNIKGDVSVDMRFLVWFFRNLLLGESNVLKNRYLHLDYERLFGDVGNDVGNVGNDVGNEAADVGNDVGNDTADVGENVGNDTADVGNDVGENVGNDAGGITVEDAALDVAEDLSDRILSQFESHPDASMAKVAEKLGVSTRHVERLVAELKREGLLERTGSKRTGTWRVVRK